MQRSGSGAARPKVKGCRSAGSSATLPRRGAVVVRCLVAKQPCLRGEAAVDGPVACLLAADAGPARRNLALGPDLVGRGISKAVGREAPSQQALVSMKTTSRPPRPGSRLASPSWQTPTQKAARTTSSPLQGPSAYAMDSHSYASHKQEPCCQAHHQLCRANKKAAPSRHNTAAYAQHMVVTAAGISIHRSRQ